MGRKGYFFQAPHKPPTRGISRAVISWNQMLASAVTRIFTTNGMARFTISPPSIISGIARASSTCMMCHSIERVKSTMGQGDFLLEYPRLHQLAASKNPAVRWIHDYVTELNPEPHRRVFLKPFMRTDTAEFCSTCHKVHLD